MIKDAKMQKDFDVKTWLYPMTVVMIVMLVMGGGCHTPLAKDPGRTKAVTVKSPEIRSECFQLLPMKGLEKSVWTNLFRASGRFETGWRTSDYQKLQDKVREAIERTGRFGKEGAVGKGMDVLSFDVRIVKNEWFSDGAARPTDGLIVEVEVMALPPVNAFGALRSIVGRGASKIYMSWGTPSCSPITIDDYCSAVADAVERALADLHYEPENKEDAK